MVKKYKVTTKITAAVLSLLMMVSVFTGVVELLPSLALAAADYSVAGYEDIDSATTQSTRKAPLGDASVTYEEYKNGAWTSTTMSVPSTELKNITTSHTAGASLGYDGRFLFDYSGKEITTWYNDGTQRRINVTVPLKSETNVKDIIVGSHSIQNFRTGIYEVFASDELGDLYTAANSVAKVDNTAAGLNKTRYQVVQVKNDKLQGTKYIGVSYYQPVADITADFVNNTLIPAVGGSPTGVYPRINGISVYGDYSAATVTVQSDNTAEIPTDCVPAKKAYTSVKLTKYVQNVPTETADVTKDYPKLLDGTTQSHEFMNSRFAFFTDDTVWNSSADKANLFNNLGTYLTYTFAVDKDMSVKKLMYLGNFDRSMGIQTGKYEIYAADTEANLYNTANRIYTFNNDRANPNGRQVYTFNPVDEANVKYIGFKIIEPVIAEKCYLDYTYIVNRVAEIGIYGDAKVANKDVTVTNDDSTDFPNGISLVPAGDSTKDPTVTLFKGTTGHQTCETANNETRLYNAHDGTDQAFYFGGSTLTYKDGDTVKFHTQDEGWYYQLTYDLGSAKNIDKFFVLQHIDPRLRLGSFKIYAGNSKADLVKDENLVYNLGSTAGKRRQILQLNEALSARYVALVTDDISYNKTWSTDASQHYLRLAEFNIYGNTDDICKLESDTNTAYNATGKTSVVKEVEFKAKAANATEAAVATGNLSTADALAALTDNKVDKTFGFTGANFAKADAVDATKIDSIYRDGTVYGDIIYTLTNTAALSDIVVSADTTDSKWNLNYKLYTASDKSKLFTGDPIATYSTAAKATQHYTLTDVTAKYVGMRITACTTTGTLSDYATLKVEDIFPKITEFAVYGKANTADVTVAEADSAALPTGVSVVESGKTYCFKDNARVEWSNSSWPVSKLFDSDTALTSEFQPSNYLFAEKDSSPSKFYNKNKGDLNVYFDIVYTLKGEANINSIYVLNHQQPYLTTGEYTLYASNDLATLFNAENELYYYKNSNAKSVQTFTVKNTKAKYVAMRVTQATQQDSAIINNTAANNGSNAYIRMFEFNVFGTFTDSGSGSGSGTGSGTGTGGSTDNIYKDQESGFNTTAPDTMPTGTNYLLGRPASFESRNAAGTEKNNAVLRAEVVTDGEIGPAADFGLSTKPYYATYDKVTGAKTWINHGIDEGSVYGTLTIRIDNKKLSLEKLFVAHSATQSLRTSKYEVYTSADYNVSIASLYADANKKATVINGKGKQTNLIEFATPVADVRVIGLKILDPVQTPFWNPDGATGSEDYPRVSEVAAFGSAVDVALPVEELRSSTSNTQLPAGVDLSNTKDLVLAGKFMLKGTIHDMQDGEDVPQNAAYDGRFSDDDASTGGDISNPYFGDTKTKVYKNTASLDEKPDGSVFLDLFYDLKSEALIDYLKINWSGNPDLIAGRYDVYVGKTRETLYDDENLYLSVNNIENYNKGFRNLMNVVCFDHANRKAASTGRYVGIRIYDPLCITGKRGSFGDVTGNNGVNYIYTRLKDMQVYGKYTDSSFDPANLKGPKFATNEDLQNLTRTTENLLTAENSKMTFYNTQGKKTDTPGKVLDAITNNDGSQSHFDVGNGSWKDGFYISFKLKKYDLTAIKGFAYKGIGSENGAYYPGKYTLFAADDVATLFDDENIIYVFDSNEYGTSRAQIIEFEDGKLPIGTYFGVRFDDINVTAAESDYWRLSYMRLWGEQGIAPADPKNLAVNMPIDASFINGSKRSEITESNFTPAELKKVTDGDYATYADIDTNKSDRKTAEIIYNLCSTDTVDQIKLGTVINSKYGFKKLKVYGSTSYDEVLDERSLLWTWTAKGNGNSVVTPSTTFSKSKTMRYVRFVFEGTNSTLRLNEIEIIGNGRQLLKTKNMTADLDSGNITVTRTHPETKLISYLNMHTDWLQALVDGDYESMFVMCDTSVIGAKYDINIRFDELITMNTLNINLFRRMTEYWPAKINVYFSQVEDDVRTSTTPNYVIDTSKVDIKTGLWTKEMRPTLIRAIRLEIIGMPQNPTFILPNGEQETNFILGDINVRGTMVKGMQLDEDDTRLVTFEDTKKNMEVSINRVDTSDIFTEVQSMKLTPEKATNWQMRSLEKSGYKIVDQKVYKIEFFDMYGNVVKDLAGRTIRVDFKTPKGAEGQTIIGCATDRTKIAASDTYEMNGYSYGTIPWDKDKDNKACLGVITTTDDSYWSSIGELEDFSEGDLSDLEEEHDEQWYESIHTTDDLFTVSAINTVFETGLKFKATDISAKATDSAYQAILEQADGKKVAAFYSLSLKKNGESFVFDGTNAVEVAINITPEMAAKFTDFEIRQITAEGMVNIPWSMYDGTTLTVELQSLDDIAIIGTAIDGSTSIGEGTTGTSNPETGEKRTATAGALLLLIAAGFVVTMNIRKGLHEK